MTENISSNLPEFYDLIVKTRGKIQRLTAGHIPAKDLLTHYILPLFATLHDELDETLEDLADSIETGVDDDVATQASAALVAMATFVEKALLNAGIIAREETPNGPSVKATDKTPAGLLEEFAVLQTQVVGALNALAEASVEDEEDDEEEDDGDEDEGDEDEGDEDVGSEERATDAAPEAPAA